MASPTQWIWVEHTPGIGDGQGGLASCGPWGCKELDTIEQLNWTVFLILSCISCSYILKMNPLSVSSLANNFSHSIGCLFTLFMVSFAIQKLLSLIRSHLFIFVFISITLGKSESVKLLSHIWLFAAPWTAVCQAPLSMEFSRQEYWTGVGTHSLLQGIFPN